MKILPSRMLPLALVTALALLFAVWLASLPPVLAAPAQDGAASAPAAPGIPISTTISGIVTLPDGSLPVPDGTLVWLYKPDPDLDTDVRGHSSVVTSSGAYSFAGIEPGVYLLRAKPPDLPPFAYAPSYFTRVEVLITPQIVNLALTYPSITGTVFAPDGTTPTHAIVHVMRPTAVGAVEVEVRTTNNGMFTIGGIPTGTYRIVAEPWTTDHIYWWSQSIVTLITPTTVPNTAEIVNLTLTAPQVFGMVKTPYNVPIVDARVQVIAANGMRRFELTDPLGRFAIDSLPGGMTATVTVEPPVGLGWMIEPAPQVVNLPNVTPMVFTIGLPNKTVTGAVRTNQSVPQPVSNALVEAHRVDRPGSNSTITDGSGNYSMLLAPGLWRVKVSPITPTVPADWYFPDEARLVEFGRTITPESKTLNFDVILADATVNGSVQLPDGSAPPFTVTVRLHRDDGIGADKKVDNAGNFTIHIPHGVYQVDLRIDSPLFAAPLIQPVHAKATGPTNLPPIVLLSRDAILRGTLSDSVGSAPVPDIPVVAWNPETRATFHMRSGPNGNFVMAVYSGTWIVRPIPQPDQPYVFTGSAANIQIVTGQIINNVDYALTPADAAIHGELLDSDGHPVLSAHGFAGAANGSVRTGAPIAAGEFDILVPAGIYTVDIHLPDDQRFTSNGQPQTAFVAAGDTATVTFSLLKKDALIFGALLNKRTGTNPVGLDGEVWAWDDGVVANTDIGPAGLFALPVPAGLWRVNYAVDTQSNWIKTEGPRSYGVGPHQQQFVPLPVVRKNGQLTGMVVLADGVTPARNVAVVADAISPDIEGVSLRTQTDDDGAFELRLPEGMYHVHASPLPGLINPAMKTVVVPRVGVATVNLQYRHPDAMLIGTVSATSPPTRPIDIFAFSDDDGYSVARAQNGATYTLPVISGQTWYVRAIAETRSEFWVTRTQIAVSAPGVTNLNLSLVGPKLKPAPVSVMFDASQDEFIALEDGTRIFVPAGALPATGTVILHITPLASVPHHKLGDTFGLSYAFEAYTADGQPIAQDFNQHVAITFKYDPAQLLSLGLNLNRIKPAYFSTTTNSWTRPDSYVVDPDHNEITLQINHFTTMGLVDAPIDTANSLYLPMIMK